MHKKVVTLLFLLVGAINFIPIIGVLGQASLQRLYDVSIGSPDIVMLLKHRAVLLAIVGGFLMVSALRPHFRMPASMCAYVSMLSYMAVFWASSTGNHALSNVYQVDVGATVLLTVALIADRQLGKRA